MAKVLLIANPIAGRGEAKSSIPVIEESFRRHAVEVETIFTIPGGNGNLATLAVDKADAVVAAGGDGTVNAIVRSLLSQDSSRGAADLPAVGIIPMGTGNASIAAFGIPRRLRDAVDVVVRGRHREVDVGIVTRPGKGTEAFLLWLGAGLDGLVMHKIHQTRSGPLGLRGILARVPAAFGSFFRYPFHDIRVEVDGQPPVVCTSAMIANVGCIPLLGRVTSHADPSDGGMEILMTSHIGLWPWLRVVFAIFRHRLDSFNGVTLLRGSHIRLSTQGEVPVQMDGDASGYLPVEVMVKPRAIRLIVP